MGAGFAASPLSSCCWLTAESLVDISGIGIQTAWNSEK